MVKNMTTNKTIPLLQTKNKTLAIIKPDITKRGLEGKILNIILENGFEISELKTKYLTEQEVKDFYHEHLEKPFFPKLKEFMLSNKIIAISLKKENAVEEWRKLIGSTDLEKRDPKSIRAKFALSLTENSVHGSDSPTSAYRELTFFGFNPN